MNLKSCSGSGQNPGGPLGKILYGLCWFTAMSSAPIKGILCQDVNAQRDVKTANRVITVATNDRKKKTVWLNSI